MTACAIALGCVALLALPAGAAADTRVTFRGGELSVTNEDAGVANRMTAEYATDGGERAIRLADDTDPAGMSFPAPTCRPGRVNGRGNPVELFCTRSAIRIVAIDLGPGEDQLSYSLDEHPATITGNLGADAVTTAGGADFLSGDQGNDVLSGRAGDDNLNGGDGADTVDAGDGNDTIMSADGVADRVACGPGVDTVSADESDHLSDCENVRRETVAPPPDATARNAPTDRTPPLLQAGASTAQRIDARRRSIRVRATANERSIVQVTGYLVAGGINRRLIPASARVTVDGGGVELLLRLSDGQLRRARRDLDRARRPRVRITVSAVDASGNTSTPRHFWVRLRH